MSQFKRLFSMGNSSFGRFVYTHRCPLFLLIAVIPTMINVVYHCLYSNFKAYWPILNYFIGYETGFGSRKLIGTIFGMVFPGNVTADHIRCVLLPTIILLVLLMVWFVWRGLSGFGKKAMPMAIVLALYAMTPFSLLEYASSEMSVCFMETYQLVLVLIWVLLFMKHRDSWYYYILTPIITVACCLIHHTFCCTLFPLFLALFVYDTISEDKVSLPKAVYYGVNILVLFVLFILLWKFSSMTVDIDTLYARTMSRTDVCTDEKEVIDLLYYTSSSQNFMKGISKNR